MRLLRFSPFALVAVVVACGSSGGSGSSSGSSSGTLPPGEDAAVDDAGVVIGPDGEVPDTSPPPPPPPVYVKSTHETTTFGGVTRKYNLSVPVDYDANKVYPLVLSFHGSPGTADLMLTYDPFDGASKKEAIIAYPNALGADWDLGTATATNPDMGFTKALVDELATKWTIDKARVFGVGWSGGGFFVNQLACRMGGLMRAMASHAGGAPYDEVNPGAPRYPNNFLKCTAAVPIASIIFHGTADPAVPYAGGDFSATYWAYVNGCSDNRSPATPAPCVSHDSCPAAAPVTFCGLPGAGHGVSANGFATSWAFFKALP
ncbi:hypothetical protein BH11MYX4_BH11MYX4_44520 [soil metagenome]